MVVGLPNFWNLELSRLAYIFATRVSTVAVVVNLVRLWQFAVLNVGLCLQHVCLLAKTSSVHLNVSVGHHRERKCAENHNK